MIRDNFRTLINKILNSKSHFFCSEGGLTDAVRPRNSSISFYHIKYTIFKIFCSKQRSIYRPHDKVINTTSSLCKQTNKLSQYDPFKM